MAALRERIVQLHSYVVPEVIALPIADGSPRYLEWLDSCWQPHKRSQRAPAYDQVRARGWPCPTSHHGARLRANQRASRRAALTSDQRALVETGHRAAGGKPACRPVAAPPVDAV